MQNLVDHHLKSWRLFNLENGKKQQKIQAKSDLKLNRLDQQIEKPTKKFTSLITYFIQ